MAIRKLSNLKLKTRPIILCGGSGTRLWPESREKFPKQFIPVLKGKTLFDLTLERLKSIHYTLTPIIITNEQYKYLVKDSLNLQNFNAKIVLEPIGKNTTAAIYIASKISDKDENLLIMPCDHYIGNNSLFVKKINEILKHTNFTNWITLGITPNYASTSYGYIKLKNNSIKNNLFEVESFIEKPNKPKANKFLKSKEYLWNSGIFIGNSKMIKNSIKANAPQISKSCDLVFKNVILSKSKNVFSFNLMDFKKIPSMSIDKSVIEKSNNIFCAHINCQWNDVGSWDKYFECFPENKRSKIVQVKSKNNYIKSNKKLIATVGIENLIIVDTSDAILISKKGLEENMRHLINSLKQKKILELTENNFENRPWGRFENILSSDNLKIKKIEVNPKSRLSKQYHNFRSEHWFITKGKALVYKNGMVTTLKKGESFDVPKKSVHYIENITNKTLEFIEIQMGTYFGEDDIIRLEDIYGRV